MKRALLIAVTVFAHSAQAAVAVRDDAGSEIRVVAPAARIVSLAPHLTELVYAAGAGPALVGASEYSDYPRSARTLPRVGGAEGIDIEAILALRADLILAWRGSGNERAIERLAALGLPVFQSDPRTLEDIPRTIERLGRLAGTDAAAARAAAEFRARAARMRARYGGLPKVRVFYEIWDRPLLTVNGRHVISRVIELCGGINVFAGLPRLVPSIDRESVVRADPDVIVASGTGANRAPQVDAWRDYRGLSAVSRDHLYTIAPDLLQRQTPRLLDGAESLCRILERVRSGR
jgi:iron complex transport system substrate-binding protein